MLGTFPVSDIDLYADEHIQEPYAAYRQLRRLGPVAWLERYQVWVVSTYQEVYEALHDHETFTTRSGVGLSEQLNRVMTGGSTLTTEPPEHDHLRSVLSRPMTPKALRQLRADIQRRADRLVGELVRMGTFDAARDLAQAFPLMVVPDLLGWPEEGREHFLTWASAAFNALGPENDHLVSSMPALQQMLKYLTKMAEPGVLRPGSWGDGLVSAAQKGLVSRDILPTLLGDYLAPSLDTTISAVASTAWLLAMHPDQWQAVRKDHSLIPGAFDEVLRYQTPVRGFTRVVTDDRQLGGVRLPAGARVLLLYASANRDESFWDDPDTFDIRRPNAGRHLGFGHGVHTCVGQGLARLEATSLLTSLAEQANELHAGELVWRLNNTNRSIASLPYAVRS
jgi:cytochrome P450